MASSCGRRVADAASAASHVPSNAATIAMSISKAAVRPTMAPPTRPGDCWYCAEKLYSPIVRRMRSGVSSGSRSECKDSPWRRRKHSDLAYGRAIL